MIHGIVYLSAKIRMCGQMDEWETAEIHCYCSDDCLAKDVAGLFLQDWMPHPSRANLLIGMANELEEGHVFVADILMNVTTPEELTMPVRCEHCAQALAT